MLRRIQAIALVSVVSLTGCTFLDKVSAVTAAPATIQNVIQTPIPGQAKSIYGAELTYDFLIKLLQHYVDSGQATASQRLAINTIVNESYPTVHQASVSAQQGNNAAVGAALTALNQVNSKLAGQLAAFGIAIPK